MIDINLAVGAVAWLLLRSFDGFSQDVYQAMNTLFGNNPGRWRNLDQMSRWILRQVLRRRVSFRRTN